MIDFAQSDLAAACLFAATAQPFFQVILWRYERFTLDQYTWHFGLCRLR